MIKQINIEFSPKSRGFHLITDELIYKIGTLPEKGLLNIFLQHTSAALSLNENTDPDVRVDMESIFNNIVKEREPFYLHTDEGDDDMPAHAKSSIIGASLNIPIKNSKLNLGTWQGIYLCEFRNSVRGRRAIVTIIS